MLIQHKFASDVLPSEITPYSKFFSRRTLLRAASAAGILTSLGPMMLYNSAVAGQKLTTSLNKKWSEAMLPKDDKLTPYNDVISYNNFYEFGTSKRDAAKNSYFLKPKPWTVVVDGLVKKPKHFDTDELIKGHELEERVYRFRCVEAWSMVVPWVGIPLANIIKRLEPLSSAKYVAFETLFDPVQMPGQKFPVLNWPYREGLRLDEAMNPLSLLTVGLYGKVLPNQNGAPIRLIIPWKYGFKSIKSIVRISFTNEQPPTSWNMSAPQEYGFYSNVNPNVHHPRWSQAKERRLGGSSNFFGFASKRPTLMFNGYAEEVAYLYKGMNLHKNY